MWKAERLDAMQHWRFINDPRYFICYEGATVKVWRELIRLERGELLEDALAHQLTAGLGKGTTGSKASCYDENLLMQRISQYKNYCYSSNHFRSVDAVGLPYGRIDRSNWVFNGRTPNDIDAHLPRPGWYPDNWSNIRALVEAYVPDDLSWADNYIREYRQSISVIK